MKRVAVWLEDTEAKALAAEAKKRGLSVSQVARERIFDGAGNADFAVYRADQQDAFRRVSDLLCDNLATVQLVTNICCDIVRGVKNDDEHVIPRLKELLAKSEQQKKELKGN